MLKQLFAFKQTDRKWHLPVLAILCVGIPVLAGYYTENMQDGKPASMAGLVIQADQENKNCHFKT